MILVEIFGISVDRYWPVGSQPIDMLNTLKVYRTEIANALVSNELLQKKHAQVTGTGRVAVNRDEHLHVPFEVSADDQGKV